MPERFWTVVGYALAVAVAIPTLIVMFGVLFGWALGMAPPVD